MRCRTLLLTDRFDKSVTIFRNPAILKGASLTDLCGVVANDFFQLRRRYWRAGAFSRERCPDACFVRTVQCDLGPFGSKNMRVCFMGLVEDHLEGG